MPNVRERVRAALARNWKRQEERQWVYGKLGREVGDDIVFDVKGRKNFVYVTIRNAVGGQTYVTARNDAGVPHTANLPVKIRLEFGVYVIEGRTGKPDEGSGPVIPPSGVLPHASTHTHGGNDEIANSIPGNNRIVKADGDGKIDNGWLNTGHDNGLDADTVDGDHASDLKDRANHSGSPASDVDWGTHKITNLSDPSDPQDAATKAYVDSVGGDDTQTEIDASIEQTTLEDANKIPLTDSGVLKHTLWSTIVSTLTTLFSTLFGLLASANTWTKNNTFSTTDTSGAALYVNRNLDAASTDAPVMSVAQLHASDNQVAFHVRQLSTIAGTLIARFVKSDVSRSWSYTANDVMVVENDGNVVIQLLSSNTGIASISFADNDARSVGAFAYNHATNQFQINGGGVTRWQLDGLTGAVLVGPVSISPNTKLGLQAGTSTNDAAVGGVLYVSTSAVGNVGTGDDILATYLVPADTLASNNQSIWIEAHGTTAANSNTKTIRLKFGSSTIATFSLGSANNTQWSLRARGYRTGSSSTKWVAFLTLEITGSSNSSATRLGTSSDSLASDRSVTITGEATSNNDIVIQAIIIGWDDANT